jgi:hypothetical protein
MATQKWGVRLKANLLSTGVRTRKIALSSISSKLSLLARDELRPKLDATQKPVNKPFYQPTQSQTAQKLRFLPKTMPKNRINSLDFKRILEFLRSLKLVWLCNVREIALVSYSKGEKKAQILLSSRPLLCYNLNSRPVPRVLSRAPALYPR